MTPAEFKAGFDAGKHAAVLKYGRSRFPVDIDPNDAAGGYDEDETLAFIEGPDGDLMEVRLEDLEWAS